MSGEVRAGRARRNPGTKNTDSLKPQSRCRSFRRHAELLKCLKQMLGDLKRIATLDLKTRDEVHKLAILEERHRGRGWWEWSNVLSHACSCVNVTSGKHCGEMIRLHR